MNKNNVIKKCNDFANEVFYYKKAMSKFKKKFPKANVYAHLDDSLPQIILVKRYGNKIEFYKTDRIFHQGDMSEPIIKLEKWSIGSWSCSNLTKMGLSEFVRDYIEVDEEYIKSSIKEYKIRRLKAIIKLRKDTLSKFKITQSKPIEKKE